MGWGRGRLQLPERASCSRLLSSSSVRSTLIGSQECGSSKFLPLHQRRLLELNGPLRCGGIYKVLEGSRENQRETFIEKIKLHSHFLICISKFINSCPSKVSLSSILQSGGLMVGHEVGHEHQVHAECHLE